MPQRFLASPTSLARLDKYFMGRLHVPKAPKKQSNCFYKSRIIVRAVLSSLSASKKLVPVASRRISSVCPPSIFMIFLSYAILATLFDCPRLIVLKMGPRDSRGSADTNRNGHGHSAGKGKAARTISRTSSNDSLRDLTPEAVDKGIAAMREICRILSFAQTYHNEIDVIESIHGLNMNQKDRIEELETMVNQLIFRKDREMGRLRDENEEYQTNAHQLEREREELEREQAAMNETRQAMQSDMEREKEKGIDEARQEFSDKNKTKIKQMREEFEKKIKAVEMERDGLKDNIKELEEKKIKAQKDMNQQKKDFEIEKRSFRSHVLRLESELRYINAASIVAPQTPEF